MSFLNELASKIIHDSHTLLISIQLLREINKALLSSRLKQFYFPKMINFL